MGKDYPMSKCCKENMTVDITEKGNWELVCLKCRRVCGVLTEKYKINELLFECRPQAK